MANLQNTNNNCAVASGRHDVNSMTKPLLDSTATTTASKAAATSSTKTASSSRKHNKNNSSQTLSWIRPGMVEATGGGCHDIGKMLNQHNNMSFKVLLARIEPGDDLPLQEYLPVNNTTESLIYIKSGIVKRHVASSTSGTSCFNEEIVKSGDYFIHNNHNNNDRITNGSKEEPVIVIIAHNNNHQQQLEFDDGESTTSSTTTQCHTAPTISSRASII